MNSFYEYQSPLGALKLIANQQYLKVLSFKSVDSSFFCQRIRHTSEHPILAATVLQLNEYFSGERTTSFELPLEPNGTAFQIKTWSSLQKIKYGCTLSYQELAQSIGNPLSSRAVGNANSKNPIAIIIPCHRIIQKNGALGGYAGGSEIKRKLLDWESRSKP